MKPYTFALTVFRLLAVCMALFVLYGWLGQVLNTASMAGRDADFDALMAFNRGVARRSALFTLASAAALYFLAPRLASVVALSKES